MRNSASYQAYREARVKQGRTVDWKFIRRCLRYRQEVKRLKDAGFRECRSFSCLPFDDQLGRTRIVETKVANGGKSLWVRVEEASNG